MTILFCIGTLHILLLTFGDILAAYALLGMTIPYFIKKSNKTLIILLIIIQLTPALEYALRSFLEYPNLKLLSKYSMNEYIQINSSTNLWDIMKLRLYDFFTFRNEKLIFYMPKELSLFLLGIICAKMNLIQKCYTKNGLIFCTISAISVAAYHQNEEQFWLLFGNEKNGVTKETLELCDGNFIIPQMGLVKSLNISVACAVTIYEAFRQRQQKI